MMHLLESILNGVVFLCGPLVLIALMAGGLVVIDRLFRALWEMRPEMNPSGIRKVST